MSPLTVFLIILVVAAIWAVVELALTIRKARTSVDEITRNANQAIEQVQPIIDKVDGMVDELQPAVKEVHPLIDKAGTAVDVATVDMAKLGDILGDVSTVSGAASNVTTTVNKVADSAATGVAGVIGKITGKGSQRPQPKLQEQAQGKHLEQSEQPAKETTDEDAPSGYVTYGGDGAGSAE